MNKFIYVLDETLANNYKLNKSFLFMNETFINDSQKAWIFSIKDNKLNFASLDKSKVLFTNKLIF